MPEDIKQTAELLNRQSQNGAGYSDDERKTLRDAADILRKKNTRGGPAPAGGPVDDTFTR